MPLSNPVSFRQVIVPSPNQAELREMSPPSIARDDLPPRGIAIRAEWSFISAGTEGAIYSGKEPAAFRPGSWCAYPTPIGYAHVGTITEAGNEVAKFRPDLAVGTRVFTFEHHQSHAWIADVREKFVAAVPKTLDPQIAAASRMAGVATSAILAADVRAGATVAIFGLGTVGNIAAQSFAARGCRVIGVDPVAFRRDLAKRCGIALVAGEKPSAADTKQQILDLTGGRGADISVDAVGHSSVVLEALAVTSSLGQLVLLGSPRVPVQGDLTALLSDVHLRMITVRGALEWSLPTYATMPNQMSQLGKQQMIFDWIERGLLKLEPLISHRIKPEQIGEAYEGLLHRPQEYVGVLIDWQ
jgi:2-desacetyl-2-hydroxyethyl bacteriochlorophyllide A dehydrogenase